jgi:hypothetical protein
MNTPNTAKPHTKGAGPRKSEQLAGQLNSQSSQSQSPKQDLPIKIKLQIIWMLWSVAALVNAGAPR